VIDMGRYIVTGRYKASFIGNVWQKFTKVLDCPNERVAIEWAYSLMGSKHGLKRNLIKVDEVRAGEW